MPNASLLLFERGHLLFDIGTPLQDANRISIINYYACFPVNENEFPRFRQMNPRRAIIDYPATTR